MASSSASKLQEIFFQAAQLVRESASRSTTTDSGNDEKLKLYGLYKHVAEGPCPGDNLPSIFQVVARAKYQAWQACRSQSSEEAMEEYVRILADRNDELGEQCRALLNNLTVDSAVRKEAMEDSKPKSPNSLSNDHPNAASSEDVQNDISVVVEAQQSKCPPSGWIHGWFAVFFGYLGVRPLIPRGILDISFSDLFFALLKCLTSPMSVALEHRLLSEISQIWKNVTQCEIAVGLSVRSILDVYLCSKSYPSDSEVIVFPPISVPGMMHVAKHHKLTIVPVDIGESNWWNLESIRAAISERTVAIMVVHPFGIVSTSAAQLQEVRRLADQHQLELWEDCAECFTGLGKDCYLGHSMADIRFLSFGLIKTATALGGSVAIFRDEQVARHVQQLCLALPQRQTSFQFLRRVLLAICLNFIGMSPMRVGVLRSLCSAFGMSYNTVVTKATRGFRLPNQSVGRMDKQKQSRQYFDFMQQIRKRPCIPLLKLLLRRFQQSARQAPSLSARLRRCQELESLLKTSLPQMLLPNAPNFNNTFWAFPICCKDRDVVSKSLLKQGYDVVSWSSQLCCVSQFTNDARQCPRALELMKSVLYLPIASLEIPDTSAFLSCLKKAMSEQDKESLQRSNNKPSIGLLSASSVVVIATLWVFQPTFHTTMSIAAFFELIVTAFLSMLCAGLFVVFLLDILRRTTANFYLDENPAFATHYDMIDAATSDKPNNFEISTDHEERILPVIESLKLPEEPSDSMQGKVILTGATGFVGSLLLRDLLFHRKRLSLGGGVIVICRQKRQKSAHSRVSELLALPMFSFLSELEKDSLVHVVEGDVTKALAGLSDADLNRVCGDDSISHVFHAAAAVGFTQSLPDAARSNITSSLNMQSLSMRLPHKNAIYVHISTAFVHGGLNGSEDVPLQEELFRLDPYDPEQLYRSMLTTQFYASKAMSELRFPNTYTFSKCVSEHLLLSNKAANTVVIRPNIVGPAMETPFEGWAGRKPSTIVAGACLHLSSQWNLWCVTRHPVSCIPVDVLSRFILAKSFGTGLCKETLVGEATSSAEGSFEKISRSSDTSSDTEEPETVLIDDSNRLHSRRIFNATWDPSSTSSKSFSWLEFSIAYLHLGCVLGYFSRAEAYLGLTLSCRLIPRLSLDAASFERLHHLLVRRPIALLVMVLESFGFPSSGVAKIAPFLDLPLLFFPFMEKPYFFQSEIVAPESFNAKRYVFSCGVAAHRFISRMTRDSCSKIQPRVSPLIIGGEYHDPCLSDGCWALTQPKGNYILRFAAYGFVKVLRAVCSVATVDVASFRHAFEIMENSEGSVHLVLAPTHRSFFDFVLLSFILFSLPELQVEIPFIVAASVFERLPVIGFFARLLGAFYVRRGLGFEDFELTSRIRGTKENGEGNRHGCFEVFLEGKRSRDRRFLIPKTGFLKSLQQSGGQHAIIPITINYESIPEQKELLNETIGKEATRMSSIGFLGWLKSALRGQVFIGKIHVAAASPVRMNCETSVDYKTLGTQVQRLQREMVFVSDYHVSAAAQFFDLDHSSMQAVMDGLGCKFWPTAKSSSRNLSIPSDKSTLLPIVLQFSSYLAPLFLLERKKWARWLYHDVQPSDAFEWRGKPEATKHVYDVLLGHFDYADSVVADAVNMLSQKGFQQPKQEHVLQVAFMLNKRPLQQIVMVAVMMQFPNQSAHDPFYSSEVVSLDLILDDTSEKLGYWGFNDSGFVATTDSRGERTVQLQGSRYALAGKNMSKLLPFIESEMQVKVNLMKEFRTSDSIFQINRPSAIDDSSKELLSKNCKRVSFSTIDRIRHGTGHSQEDVYAIREGCNFRVPDAIVWPESEVQVKKLVVLAKENNWCIIPFGGGTNVTCATRCPTLTVETRPIISVDMKLMSRILWLNGEDGVARVEAGITGKQLVDELKLRGYTMGHEPDSIEFSTLGGWIATKASGMKRSKYGNIEDIVKDVAVVGDELISQGGMDEKIVCGRTSEGLDLLSLVLGSEGCLGIITSAVVRIWPLPEVQEYDSIIFPSFKDGLAFARAVSRLEGNAPASVRLLDNAHFRLGQALRPENSSSSGHLKELIARFVAMRGNFRTDSLVCATITYEGFKTEVKGQKRAIQKMAQIYDGRHLGPSVGRSGYELTFLIAYLRDFAMTYHLLGESFETFVPWSKVDVLIRATKKRIREEHQSQLLPGVPFVGCRVTQLYHEGACLYFYLCISIDGVDNGSEIFSSLEKAAREEILKHGGSLSHHHGIGKVRAAFHKDRLSHGLQQMVQMVKRGIDKENIFGARNGHFSELDAIE